MADPIDPDTPITGETYHVWQRAGEPESERIKQSRITAIENMNTILSRGGGFIFAAWDPEAGLWYRSSILSGEGIRTIPEMRRLVMFTVAYCAHLKKELADREAELDRRN